MIDKAAAAQAIFGAPDDIGAQELLDRVEKAVVLDALARSGWNKSLAGSRIGLKRTTICAKMLRLGIPLMRQPYPQETLTHG